MKKWSQVFGYFIIREVNEKFKFVLQPLEFLFNRSLLIPLAIFKNRHSAGIVYLSTSQGKHISQFDTRATEVALFVLGTSDLVSNLKYFCLAIMSFKTF